MNAKLVILRLYDEYADERELLILTHTWGQSLAPPITDPAALRYRRRPTGLVSAARGPARSCPVRQLVDLSIAELGTSLLTIRYVR